MATTILEKLEEKIDISIETIELLRLQLEEAEEKIANLEEKNFILKNRQTEWEQNLSQMLQKLEIANPSTVVTKAPIAEPA
jgi:cell division protein ZapB